MTTKITLSKKCLRNGCRSKPKYYSCSSCDNDENGEKESWCKECFREIHQFHEIKLVCKECGKPITETLILSTAYKNAVFCSLDCAAHNIGYKTKKEF